MENFIVRNWVENSGLEESVYQNEVDKISKRRNYCLFAVNSICEPITVKKIIRDFYNKEVGCIVTRYNLLSIVLIHIKIVRSRSCGFG